MAKLIDEVPEARSFLDAVKSRIEDYKLFPSEQFAKVIGGVLASSSVDRHGDRFDRAALHQLVDIPSSGRWVNVQHDPRIHPVGRFLAARLFHLPVSNTDFVVAIAGIYDLTKLPTFADVGLDLDAVQLKEDTGPIDADLRAVIAFAPREVDASVVETMLQDAPAIVMQKPKILVRKAFEAAPMIHFLVPFVVLLWNPFSKKFLERLGERSADAVADFFGWLTGKAIVALRSKCASPTLIEFDSDYAECDVVFVLELIDDAQARVALEKLSAAAALAQAVIDEARERDPAKIVIVFSKERKEWEVQYLITRVDGITTDRPQQISLDGLTGFSVTGAVGQTRSEGGSSVDQAPRA